MKGTYRRYYLIAALMGGLILLSLSGGAPNRSSAGQGKGGEVIAKPTPTPKKTTTTKRAPAKNSKTSRPAKSSDNATAAELIFWNSIKDSTNPEDAARASLLLTTEATATATGFACSPLQRLGRDTRSCQHR